MLLSKFYYFVSVVQITQFLINFCFILSIESVNNEVVSVMEMPSEKEEENNFLVSDKEEKEIKRLLNIEGF